MNFYFNKGDNNLVLHNKEFCLLVGVFFEEKYLNIDGWDLYSVNDQFDNSIILAHDVSIYEGQFDAQYIIEALSLLFGFPLCDVHTLDCITLSPDKLQQAKDATYSLTPIRCNFGK